MLILVGVVVSTTINSDLINDAKEAKGEYEKAEEQDSNIAGMEVGGVIYDKLQDYLDEVSVQVELEDGTKRNINQRNFGEYLGKKVTNYTGETSVTIGETAYTVSPEYRLYYIDFENKYGDGVGTIYLKAECASSKYGLGQDTTSANSENIKIKNLNPALYTTGVTSPRANQQNMLAVTWLTNTTNWASLKDTDMSSNINYIVGAPSVEMMMDSYNTHYGLSGNIPDVSDIIVGERKKLFYRYQSGGHGYDVGPYANTNEEYTIYTSDNSVYTDSAIDSMYYPGDNQNYWLASPSMAYWDNLVTVDSRSGGCVYWRELWFLQFVLSSSFP